MQTRKLTLGLIAALLVIPAIGAAEEKAPPPDVPLRITVLFNEYDGSRKIASLPYVMPCKASFRHDPSQLRTGYRVPYKSKQDEIQYQGGFMVHLAVSRLTVYSLPHGSDRAAEWHPDDPLSNDPVFGEITANMSDLLVHDGQTVEATVATDPVNGHVWKVEVTLNVVK
jgi:hypothetical protein